MMTMVSDIHGTREELVAFIAQQHGEITRLRKGMEEYACTGTDKPCGCYTEFVRDTAEIERLRAALETIANHSSVHSDFPHSAENLQRLARQTLTAAGGQK